MDGLLVKPISHENWSERMSWDAGCQGSEPVNDRSQVRLITCCHRHFCDQNLSTGNVVITFDLLVNGSLCQYESVEEGEPSLYISFNIEVAIFTIQFMLFLSTETCSRIMPAKQSRYLTITDSCLCGIWQEWGIIWIQLSINHSRQTNV